MSGNKNQHIVPQFFLKNFSENRDDKNIKDKIIYKYNTKNENLKHRAVIRKTCTGSYFYETKDGFDEVDNVIKSFEDVQAPILSDLINKRELPSDPNKMGVLYTFIMLLYTRTKSARECAVERKENFLTEECQKMLKEIGYPNHKAKVSVDSLEAQFDVMKPSVFNSYALDDLSKVLLINESGRHFITSDNPVVFYNYKMIENKCITGVICSGLMILCPLTESLLLLFFDKDLYDVRRDTRTSIIVKKDSDVDSINRLQLLNCYEEVYCCDECDLPYIEELYTNIKENMTKREIITTEHPNAQNNEVHILNPKDVINYKTKLSFLNFNKENNRKYKRVMRNHKKDSNPYPVTRMELLSYRE